jgi:hypothetical protein
MNVVGALCVGRLGRANNTHSELTTSHHKYANTIRNNSDYLYPISFRENTVQMMQGNYYVHRIIELEDALASIAPHHPAKAACLDFSHRCLIRFRITIPTLGGTWGATVPPSLEVL